MILKARDIGPHHLGKAVSIPYRINPQTFVLANYRSILWKPSLWTDTGHVDLADRQGIWHSIDPDDELIIEP
jgi:hypothetical protein